MSPSSLSPSSTCDLLPVPSPIYLTIIKGPDCPEVVSLQIQAATRAGPSWRCYSHRMRHCSDHNGVHTAKKNLYYHSVVSDERAVLQSPALQPEWTVRDPCSFNAAKLRSLRHCTHN